MSKAALFIGWGAIIPGREKKAEEVLHESVAYCTRLQQQGVIDSFEAFFLEPHGGELEGFVIVRGDKDSIAKLRLDEEFQSTIVAVQLVHTKVGVVGAYTGRELQSVAALWSKQEARILDKA